MDGLTTLGHLTNEGLFVGPGSGDHFVVGVLVLTGRGAVVLPLVGMMIFGECDSVG
jgi:hypothetical protein